jgi:cell division protease FtsH
VAHHSEQTGTLIDEEVRNILVRCQQDANNLLETNRTALDKISAYLLEKENITGQEFMQLLGESLPAKS